MGIILVLVFVIFMSFGRLQLIKQSRVIVNLALEDNYRLSFELVDMNRALGHLCAHIG